MSNPVTFEIGITMAGAISAGAYAGGFFDFLCEALEEWEKARIAAPHAVPNHRVCIKAISGASAGSITAALALVSLAKANPPPTGVPYTLSGLYRGWVTGIDIARAGGADDLLDLSDLEMAGGGEKDRKEAVIRSLLSTSCIDKVAQAIVAAPPAPTGRLYAWLASPLPCYFTITNMRGIPYMVRFDKDRGHGMVSHADRAHFSLKGLGGCEADNVWCKNDAPVDISLNDMRSGNAVMQPFLDAALASGAFPVGLSSRKVTLALDGYDKRQWPRLDGIGTRIAPDWPGNFRLDRKGVPFMAIDGGLIDNEPFGLVHRALLPAGSDHNPPNADEVVRAVIMIDPFPEIPTFEVNDEQACDETLVAVVKSIFPVLKNQARFKPDEVIRALDPSRYSRYLATPRDMKEGAADSAALSSAPLATSLLGGFGGFLDESFRAYDYQLGRRNCQRFLGEHFAVGLKNPIAWDKVSQKSRWDPAVYDAPEFRDEDKTHLRIVPLLGTAGREIVKPQWPRITFARFKEIEGRVEGRLDALTPRIFHGSIPGRLVRMLANLVWVTLWGRDAALKFIRWSILSELIERDQLMEYKDLDEQSRAVAVAMSDTKFHYCSEEGLAARLSIKPQSIPEIIQRLKRQGPMTIWSGNIDGYRCHTWEDKRPGLVARFRAIGGPPLILRKNNA